MPELKEFPETSVQVIELGRLKEPNSIRFLYEKLGEEDFDMFLVSLQEAKVDFQAMVDDSIIERMMK